MDNNKEMFEHVLFIRERLAVIESKQDSMKAAVVDLRLDSKRTETRLEAVEKDLQTGKASLSLLKWIAGIVIAVGGMLIKAISTLKTGQS